MKRFIKSILWFCIFTSVFYIVCIIIWGEFSPVKKNLRYRLKPDGHTFTRLKELRSTKNIDILFLGSSHTYRGFDNRIFEQHGLGKSFNLGSNSQTPLQTQYLLHNYLDSLSPKIVVYEVCPFVFSLDGVESTLEIIANDKINKYSFDLIFKQNHLKAYNAMIFTLYRRFFYSDLEDTQESIKNNNDTYIPGGFVDIKLMYYDQMEFEDQKWIKNSEQLKAFENTVKMLNDRNIDLILVQAPVTTGLYNSYVNNPYFDNEISKYGRYYNFNELLKLNDTVHFFDYHHLNQNGIKIFNQKMVDLLKKFEMSE